MRVLADTHAFLWFLFGDLRISTTARQRLTEGQIVFSKVSLWEISIKSRLGKLALGGSYESFVDDLVLNANVEVLDLDVAHLVANAALPLNHRDPFDRMLAAQAITENLPVITSDPSFKTYGVKTIW